MYRVWLLIFVFVLSSCVTTDKPKAAGHFEQGNEYAADGLLREAIDSYNKELRENPHNTLARRNLGIVFVKAKSYKAAITNFEKIIGSLENDFDSNFYLGEAYRATDKYAEAIYRYKKALSIRSNEVKVMKALAWSYYRIRYYSEALDIARNIIKQVPNDTQAAIILARVYLKVNKPKAALSVIHKAKSVSPQEAHPFLASVEGDIYLQTNKYENAIKTYREALAIQPLLAGALLGLGKGLLMTEKDNDAIAYIERAIRIRPQLTEGYYLLGKAYESIDKRKSIAHYRNFSKRAAKDPDFLAMLGEVEKKIGALK